MAKRNPILNAAWKRSMQSGTEQDFLARHPRYAKRLARQPRQRLTKLPPDTRELVQADIQTENKDAINSIQYDNPDYIDPTSSQEVTFDENGNPVVKTTLSGDQQNILDTGETITQEGQGKALEQLRGFGQFSPGDTAAERQRIEDAVFQNLTRDTKQSYDQDVEAMEQKMYNRGIPLDPTNPLYQREREALDKRYDRAKLEARGQATQLGGQEQINQYNMGLSTHQQQLSDIGTLQQQGSGYMAPTQRAYNAPGYDLASASDISFALEQLKQGQQGLNIQQQAVNKAGQAAPAAEPPNPFE